MAKKDETEKQNIYEHICTKACFRGGVYYNKKDILKSPDSRVPKHFRGYDSEKDPDAPKKQAASKKKATPTKVVSTKEGELGLDDGKDSQENTPKSSKIDSPKEGDLGLGNGKE